VLPPAMIRRPPTSSASCGSPHSPPSSL